MREGGREGGDEGGREGGDELPVQNSGAVFIDECLVVSYQSRTPGQYLSMSVW